MERERLPGVRKVWGTMKACSSGAVAATIVRISPDVVGKIQLRRKYKTNNSGRTTRWWFIPGEEMTLMKLEERWEGIFNQTAWKLEYCFMVQQRNYKSSQSNGQYPPPTPSPTSSPHPCPISLLIHLPLLLFL